MLGELSDQRGAHVRQIHADASDRRDRLPISQGKNVLDRARRCYHAHAELAEAAAEIAAQKRILAGENDFTIADAAKPLHGMSPQKGRARTQTPSWATWARTDISDTRDRSAPGRPFRFVCAERSLYFDRHLAFRAKVAISHLLNVARDG